MFINYFIKGTSMETSLVSDQQSSVHETEKMFYFLKTKNTADSHVYTRQLSPVYLRAALL